MQNFQQILTQAAQLKQHQLKKERKGYQSLPQFVKAGLGYNKKYQIIRKQNFHYQFRISNKVKQQGNVLFKYNKIEQALSKYEQALAIFRYINARSYENIKDQDLEYCNYNPKQLPNQLLQKYQTHLCALYLNICTCLTKQNKKQDAIHSAGQALKIKKTSKAHYRKAQAYLKYVNRDINDIKLGILQLKQAYSIQKNAEILNQMYAAKDNYEKQHEKSKNWFKFMFDKNKKQAQQNNQPTTQQIQPKAQKKQTKYKQKQHKQPTKQQLKQQKYLTQLQKASQSVQISDQLTKLQQRKQKLQHYIKLQQNQWQIEYIKDFIKRNGSKIYSILKIYKQQDLANQFKGILAKCLQNSKDKNKQKQIKNYEQFFAWLKTHPISFINKYIQRYQLQTSWIRSNRNENQTTVSKQQKIQQKTIQKYTKKQNKKQEIKQEIKQEKQQVSQEIRDIIQENKMISPAQISNNTRNNENKRRNMFRQQMQNTQGQQKTDKKKIITVGIIIFLLILRFLLK